MIANRPNYFSKKSASLLKFGNADIYSYPAETRAISIAKIELNGRHPDTKEDCFIETDLHLVFFIIKGNGEFTIDGNVFEVGPEDEIVIYPNQKYYISGNLSYVVGCTPGYYPEQNIIANKND